MFRSHDDESALSAVDSVADIECSGVTDYRECAMNQDRVRGFGMNRPARVTSRQAG